MVCEFSVSLLTSYFVFMYLAQGPKNGGTLAGVIPSLLCSCWLKHLLYITCLPCIDVLKVNMLPVLAFLLAPNGFTGRGYYVLCCWCFPVLTFQKNVAFYKNQVSFMNIIHAFICACFVYFMFENIIIRTHHEV